MRIATRIAVICGAAVFGVVLLFAMHAHARAFCPRVRLAVCAMQAVNQSVGQSRIPRPYLPR